MKTEFKVDKFKQKVIEEVKKAVVNNLGDFLDSLRNDQRQDAQDCIDGITNNTIKLALADTDEEKEQYKRTIEHYKNALENIEGAVAYKTYSRVVQIIGDVIMAIGAAAVAALL